MEDINELRLSALSKVIVAFFSVPLAGYLTFKFSTLWWHYLIGVFFVVIIIAAAVDAVEEYKNSFIHNILNPLLEANGLEYLPNEGFSEELALSSGLFEFDYDDYESYSLIVGDDFQLAYVSFTKEEEKEDSEGNIRTETVTQFAGFLIILKHERFVNKYVIVEPSRFHISDLLPVTYDRYRVKLDNPEFEKIFDVYSSDQVEARYLLDHNYMEKLIQLYENAGVEYISFINDIVYTSLDYKDFEHNIPIFRKINDKIIQEILFPVEYAVYVKEVLNKESNERQKSI